METRSSVQYWQMQQRIERSYPEASRALPFQRRFNARNLQSYSQLPLHEVNIIDIQLEITY